ncbi:histidine phosphatase family protein [Thalassobacillus hwangdonensis]|uniref:Histidine phosphatase family protein n=1 Tax=Thalassobacillus hwangdonensis TaxID=546108 RepID=A0ABW3L456_9BACI
MTTIGFVRHGITEWNVQKRVQGTTDIPLNDTGKQQAEAAGERLTLEEPWDLIISSDLGRASETASIIGEKLGVPIDHKEQRIRELNCGEIEGTTEEERVEKWGPNWRELDLGMDSYESIGKRGLAYIEELATTYGGKRVLVVSHGGFIGLTMRYLLPEMQHTNIGNTSVTVIEKREKGWSCSLYNCSKHLDAVEAN